MIKSMTAFGRAVHNTPKMDVTVEIRSVNSRYFDCSVKLPRIYSFLEDRIKACVQSKGVSRGKVEVYIGIDVLASDVEIELDAGYAAGYIGALRRLRDEYSLADDMTVMSVAQNRDIFTVKKPDADNEEDWEKIKTALDAALDMFLDKRAKEGDRIEGDIRSKAEGLKALAQRIKELSETDTSDHYDKLLERIRKLIGDNNIVIDEARLLTECAIFADRVAIDEELVRLSSHFAAFEDILSSKGPVGRELDFQLQEMNREVNTIGSKCTNVAITKLVVTIKSELEKIREQIQNIE